MGSTGRFALASAMPKAVPTTSARLATDSPARMPRQGGKGLSTGVRGGMAAARIRPVDGQEGNEYKQGHCRWLEVGLDLRLPASARLPWRARMPASRQGTQGSTQNTQASSACKQARRPTLGGDVSQVVVQRKGAVDGGAGGGGSHSRQVLSKVGGAGQREESSWHQHSAATTTGRAWGTRREGRGCVSGTMHCIQADQKGGSSSARRAGRRRGCAGPLKS